LPHAGRRIEAAAAQAYTGAMKPIPFLLAALLLLPAGHARAVDAFAAVEGSPLTLWRACTWLALCPNSGYNASSAGYGMRAGFWLPHESETARSALELGYLRLGATSGSKDYLLNPGCLIFCAGATATWHNDATLAYLDWQGRVVLGSSGGKGALTGKIGVYHAIVTTTGNFGVGGPDYTRRITSNGLMIGSGYAYPLSPHWSAQAGADAFFNVRVANPIDPGGALSELVLRLWVGAGYDF
jgi:hypothetical protein